MPRLAPPAWQQTRSVTSKQLNLSLTPDERDVFDRLAVVLGAPIKSGLLAAARAALLVAEGKPYPSVRRELRADLAPGKPGPKVADEEE